MASECLIVLEACQRVGEIRDHGFNWTLEFANRWQADYPYNAADGVRPSTLERQTGFEYISDGGQSNGKKEPSFSKITGATTVDGSISWTTVALSNTSLERRLVQSYWDDASALFTITDENVVDSPGLQLTSAKFTCNTTGVYDLINRISTDDGLEFTAILRMTILA